MRRIKQNLTWLNFDYRLKTNHKLRVMINSVIFLILRLIWNGGGNIGLKNVKSKDSRYPDDAIHAISKNVNGESEL